VETTRRWSAQKSLEQVRALENGVKVHVLVTKHGSPAVATPADAKALEQKLARAKKNTEECLGLNYIFVPDGVSVRLGKAWRPASLGTYCSKRADCALSAQSLIRISMSTGNNDPANTASLVLKRRR